MLNIGKIKLAPSANPSSREAFLDTRWRHSADEMKRYDKASFGLGSNRYYDETADLTEQILSSYNTCANERRSSWMRDLAKDSIEFIADVRGLQYKAVKRETIFNQSIAHIVTEIFTMLRAYSFEFNHSVGWNDLYITCSKPGFVTEVTRYNIFREPVESVTNFRARLSTRSWSVVIRGRKNKIDVMLIPVYKVIGLSKVETEFPPILSLTGTLTKQQVQWHLNGQPLLEGQLETIAMEVFASLINKSKEAIQNNVAPVNNDDLLEVDLESA